MIIRKNKLKDVCVVVPSIRNNSIKLFLKAWEKEFRKVKVIVVEDNPTKTFELPSWVEHYSWEEIDKELGKNSWIISRRNAAIRCFGFLKAWQFGSKYIITLDDDCLPEKQYTSGFIEQIIQHLESEWQDDRWWNTVDGVIYPRGFPYGVRDKIPTVVHHGLWSNIPDLDGLTQKKYPKLRTKPFKRVEKVPFGKFFPMCSMNLAFKREMLPAMYFPLMGESEKGKKWPYDRFDDIWAGIFVKKICDYLNLAISSGGPSVHHAKASDTALNIKKEKSGMSVNETFWKEIYNVPLRENTVNGSYLELAKATGKKKGKYWKDLSVAMRIWLKILEIK